MTKYDGSRKLCTVIYQHSQRAISMTSKISWFHVITSDPDYYEKTEFFEWFNIQKDTKKYGLIVDWVKVTPISDDFICDYFGEVKGEEFLNNIKTDKSYD